MLRAFLAVAVIPAAAFAIAMPAPATADSECTTAPFGVLAAGPFDNVPLDDPLDPTAEDLTPTPSVPNPPTPTCYGCPTGYHCAHNPERCVPD